MPSSQMTAFMRVCEREAARRFESHSAFHRFSIAERRRFWSLFLRWSEIAHEGEPEPVCTSDECERAVFFPNVRLNYVENLLRLEADFGEHHPALSGWDVRGRRQHYTRGELRHRVRGVAHALSELGVVAGDRVVAIAHNDCAAVIGSLGAVAIGATLSTVAPTLGASSILDRFAALKPKVMLVHLHAIKHENLVAVLRGLPTLESLVVLDDGPLPTEDLGVPVVRLEAMTSDVRDGPWPRFPFNHPLFLLFSSGTTGPPKCIVHGAGGTLLEHLKEHRLHGDLRPSDKLFFFTSCSWMMWNWQLSALAAGAEIVLYPGRIKGPNTLWRIVADERITVFGGSPAYFQICEDAGFSPKREVSLDRLRVVLSTGSILYDEQFDWLSLHVKDVPVQSISGGTDIIGCFVLGHPDLPVTRGESQCISLGMDVRSIDGELVCANPFPSRPLGFDNDEGGARFHEAYFAQNPGMWTHGDRITISDRGSVRVHGRSDGVLNIAGIRIGPAEIYRVLQRVPEVCESLAVEQQADRGSRLVLLVVLRPGASLDAALKRRIKHALMTEASPAHVPEVILAVDQLPATHSGKRSERAARDAINGRTVANEDALANPESLGSIRIAIQGTSDESPASIGRHASPVEVLTRIWQRVLDTAPVDPSDNFFDLGGTSLLTLRLCNEILLQTGWQLSPSAVFDAPTIAEMVALVEKGAPFSPLVPLARGRGRPVFLIHGLAGDILELHVLGQHLRGDRPVFGLRARGLDARDRPFTTVEEMADYYLRYVLEQQPEEPYAFVGYSFGGLVALEMARRLRERGARIELVGLIDTELHDNCLPPLARTRFRALRRLHRVLHKGGLDKLAAPLKARLHATCDEAAAPPWQTEQLTPAMQNIATCVWRAFEEYRPSPYPGPITYFAASVRSPDYFFPIPIWSEVCGGRLSVVSVPGNHFSMVREPNVSVLAERLFDCLESDDEPASVRTASVA